MSEAKEIRLKLEAVLLSQVQPVLVAHGELVDDHPTDPRLKAGTKVITSEVIAVDESLILTKSGTRYRLI